jgi:hypothetical protein
MSQTQVKEVETDEFSEVAEGKVMPTNEMFERIKEVLEKHGVDTSSFDEREIESLSAPAKEPLEEAVQAAIYSLEEIRLYASYGRTSECEREATEALEKIVVLHTKWSERNAIMDALKAPAEPAEEEFQ